MYNKNSLIRVADLYIRVSTDEQAERGYSQRDQAERLREYCTRMGLTIGQTIFEDHSAKNFERPEWSKYFDGLKKRKKEAREARLLLFTKWDRFSRNTGDAYQMIKELGRLSVEPQAIEQPLDLRVPENRIVLGVYLSTPEVENLRRAINVFNGMRRARKEGRIMGLPPYGYINRCTEDGTKYIGVKYPEAENIIWAFNEIVKGKLPSEHVRLLMNKREGKNLTRNAFMVAVRNPVYVGKVFIPEHENEEAHFVKGKHLPLIDEELFYRVQDVLDGKSRRSNVEVSKNKVLNNESFPLRGVLVCPRCGSHLTASRSKGNTKYYSYYHCNSKCGFRHNSEAINNSFIDELKRFDIKVGMREQLGKMLLKNYKRYCGSIDDERKEIVEEIEKLNLKQAKARDLFLTDRLDEEDYAEVKVECRKKLEELEETLKSLTRASKDNDIPGKLKKALDAISGISERYKNSDIEDKRKIASSIYHGKLEFDGRNFRTPISNSFLQLISLTNSGLEDKKKGLQDLKNLKDQEVSAKGFEPLTVCLEGRCSIQLSYAPIIKLIPA